MHISQIIACIIAVFSFGICQAAPDEQNRLSIRSHDISQSRFDGIFVRHLFYQTAYASASQAMIEAIDAYQSFDWCVNKEADWCPEVINSTLSTIAGRASRDAAFSIDVDNCDDQCLVTSLPTLSSKAAFSAMVWAEKTFNGTNRWQGTPQGKADIEKLRRTMWELRKEAAEPIKLDDEMLSSMFSCECNPKTNNATQSSDYGDENTTQLSDDGDDYELDVYGIGIVAGHSSFGDDWVDIDSTEIFGSTVISDMDYSSNEKRAAESPARGCICRPDEAATETGPESFQDPDVTIGWLTTSRPESSSKRLTAISPTISSKPYVSSQDEDGEESSESVSEASSHDDHHQENSNSTAEVGIKSDAKTQDPSRGGEQERPSSNPESSQVPEPQTDAPARQPPDSESSPPDSHEQSSDESDDQEDHDDNDDNDDDDDDDDHHGAILAATLPLVATGATLLAPYVAQAAVCVDPVLCEISKLRYLPEVLSVTSKVLKKVNPFSWFGKLFHKSKDAKNTSSPHANVPTPEAPPTPPQPPQQNPPKVPKPPNEKPHKPHDNSQPARPPLPEQDQPTRPVEPSEKKPKKPHDDNQEPFNLEWDEGKPPLPVDFEDDQHPPWSSTPQESPPKDWNPEDDLDDLYEDDVAHKEPEEDFDDLDEDDDFPLEPEGEVLENPLPFDPNPPFEAPEDQGVVPEVPSEPEPDSGEPDESEPEPESEDEIGEIEPVNLENIFRAERYDPKTGRLEQQTLLRAPPKRFKNAIRGQQLLKNGYKPYFPLDSDGRIMRNEFGYRTVYQRPADLKPMEGDWRRITHPKSGYDQYVRYENGRPATSSLGDPLVRSPNNVMETAESAESQGRTRFNDDLRFRLYDTEGNAVQGSRDGSKSLLELSQTDPKSVEWTADDQVPAESADSKGEDYSNDGDEEPPSSEPEDRPSVPQFDGPTDDPPRTNGHDSGGDDSPQAKGHGPEPTQSPEATPKLASPGDSPSISGEVGFDPEFEPNDHPKVDEHAPEVTPTPKPKILEATPVAFITVTTTVTAAPEKTPWYKWHKVGDWAGIPYKCTAFYDGPPLKECVKYYKQLVQRGSKVWDLPCSFPLFWMLPPELRPQPDPERAILCTGLFPIQGKRILKKNGEMKFDYRD